MDPTNALNAHAAPSPGPDPFPPPDSGASQPPPVHPVPDPPHLPPEAAPPAPPPTTPTHSLVQSGEQCPSCGAHVAPDQRYCLACGARCGEPRLPFMSAVTFMDAMKTPASGVTSSAPPRRPQRRISSNMALFATIGVLLLAMGVGVLIGRSGNHSVATAPQAAPIVIHGGGEEAKAATPEAGAGKIGGSSKKAKPKVLKKEAETGAGAEEVLKPANGVKLPKATAKLGETCHEGTAGCTNGKFEGKFFGE